MSNPKPLEGVKVVELATFIAAPCCCRFLADLGAEVTKIEAPKGDQLRFTAVNEGRPYGDAEDTSYTLENTGKKFITLNTKTEAGREVVEKLIAGCDIFVTNWREQPLKRAGLDYESLKQRYPSLVMGRVSGYGEKGPDKDLPGFDFTAYFARSGVLGTMYDVDSMPMLPIAGFGDHQVAMNLAAGFIARPLPREEHRLPATRSSSACCTPACGCLPLPAGQPVRRFLHSVPHQPHPGYQPAEPGV